MSIKVNLESGEVTMRTPKVRDLRAVSSIKDQTEQDIHMFSNLTGLPPDEINDLTLNDFMTLQEAFRGFLS
jgi:hypothetical protein